MIVVRDVLALVFPTGNEGWVEEGSGLRLRGEFSVHLGMFGDLGVKECGSTGRAALWDMGINGVTMPHC